ncbi:S17A9 protein, partial [Polypterus senegalus]
MGKKSGKKKVSPSGLQGLTDGEMTWTYLTGSEEDRALIRAEQARVAKNSGHGQLSSASDSLDSPEVPPSATKVAAVARIWTLVLLIGTCLLYCARVAMPICAVAMADQFKWSKKESGIALGSFFWGYCLTQVLGGYISDRVGGEKVLLLSATAWGCLTAFTPMIAHISSVPLLSLTLSRFLTGLLQGVHFPSLASLFSQKVRENERAFISSTVGTGSQFG